MSRDFLAAPPDSPPPAQGPATATPQAPSAAGLTSEEARRRLATHGTNEIHHEEPTPPWRVFVRQFQGALIWLLIGATIVSAFLGEVADALAIGAILVLNAFVGFLQEFRSERAVLALRSLSAPRARVLRDGHAAVIPAAEVVPGDVLVLEAGDVVAADARLLEAHLLATNEASLTGESTPVEKDPAPVAEGAALAERRDCVFLGTAVSGGTGRAEVFATGMRTELGKIAHLITTAEVVQTPLQGRLERVGRTLLILCLGIVVVVAVASLLRGMGALQVLLSSVSLAVAAVPEGLAAVVTIALAVGVQRMAARNALVRQLPAVETLGSATVICTDKTGTLTAGVMAVRELWGPDPARLLFVAAANCDAELDASRKAGAGDPTEVAILVAAAERGILREEIERERPRREVRPFDAVRKSMSILRADGVLYLKGAVEVVLSRCARGTEGAAEANARMAERGLRVLAVAEGQGGREEGLTLVGLIGIADPPRPEAIEAVAQARAAGIRTVMITGDHPVTAQAIAKEMGILGPGDDPAQIVHARATPEDKLKIVREWKARGAVVAMTGDGVNDAPALKEAHIGIAMGKTGTEVAREAAAVVLTDDNFASIVAAVREGRGIYENIKKTLIYLLAGNFGELLLMLAAALVGLPLPLLPLQLLWINLVTDGLPALALVMDPTRADVLARPPRRPDEPMLGFREWRRIVLIGLLDGGITFATFLVALRLTTEAHARGFAFSVLVFCEVFRSVAARSETKVAWEVGMASNRGLLAVMLGTVFAQFVIYRLPVTERLFDIDALSVPQMGLTLLIGLIPVTVLELSKLFARMRRPVAGAPA